MAFANSAWNLARRQSLWLLHPQVGPVSGPSDNLDRTQARYLYLSHFLSIWVSRSYEYSAILLAQHIFPGTLVPAALLGIVECMAILLCSPSLGNIIDRDQSRLRPVTVAIVVNRVTLVVACFLWLTIIHFDVPWLSKSLFAFILCLTGVELVSRIANTLSFERDWIPTLANHANGQFDASRTEYTLTHLNTVICRIDSIGKLGAPVVASASLIVVSPSVMILLLGSFSAFAGTIEIWALRNVWCRSARLRLTKPKHLAQSVRVPEDSWTRSSGDYLAPQVFRGLAAFSRAYHASLGYYFTSDVFEVSFSNAVLYTTVLVWGGTLLTWLLNSGFSYTGVTLARSACAIFEFGATLIYPLAVRYFRQRQRSATGPAYATVSSQMIEELPVEAGLEHLAEVTRSEASEDTNHGNTLVSEDSLTELEEPATTGAVTDTSKASSIALLVTTIPTVIFLFKIDFKSQNTEPFDSRMGERDSGDLMGPTVVLFITCLALSLFSRSLFNTAGKQVILNAIPAGQRSRFGGIETAVGAIFSLAHLVAAAIWSSQTDFKWLGLAGLLATCTSTILFLKWYHHRQGGSRPQQRSCLAAR